MREILFRGKSIDNGKWKYSMSLARHATENGIITSYYIGSGYDIVKAETVGQYTGLTDKNGTKIFEGDILSYEYGDLKKRGFVFYYDRGAKFGIKENDGHNNLSLLHDTQVRAWNIKVIGNIHDNPELLKGDKSDA